MTEHIVNSISTELKPKSSLGRKLVFFILAANIVLSIFTSGTQLYLSYLRDRNEVLESLQAIDESFRVSFENALWQYNYRLIEALMDGVFSKSDIARVELEASSEGKKWIRGTRSSPGLIMRTLDFVYVDETNASIPVGKMTVGLTLANVKARLLNQFWTLIFSNFIKTIIASFIMLAFFNVFVTRHLKKISTYVSNTSWIDLGSNLKLARAVNRSQDDLDHIVSAINIAKENTADAYRKMDNEINHRRRAEEKLEKKALLLQSTNRELLLTNREQAEFTYAISHDLKSPTNTIGMFLNELALSHKDELSADGLELIDIAQNTVTRMSQLIEDVLIYSRTVDETIELVPLDLMPIVRHVIEDLQADIKHADAVVDVQKLPIVLGNESKLRMLFQNLISNAIKFHSPERTPKIRICASDSPDDHMISVKVIDNGIGIDSKYYDKIFTLFQRLHAHNDYAGSGIGLALCKRIVTNHNGQIRVHSVPQKGTTFEILFKKINYEY